MPLRRDWILLALIFYWFATFVSMATMSIGAGFFALIVTFYWRTQLVSNSRTMISSDFGRRYFLATLWLTVACALSLVVAALWPMGFGKKFVEVSFFRDMTKILYLYWPIILGCAIFSLQDHEKTWLLRTAIRLAALLCLMGIFQYFFGWPRPQIIPGSTHYHVTLFIGHHLSVSSIFIFPFFIALIYSLRKTGPKLLGMSRTEISLELIIMALALVGTYSRTLWVALAFGIFASIVWSSPKQWRPKLIGVWVLSILIILQFPNIRNRLMDPKGVFQGTAKRDVIWLINWQFFENRPITGTGWHHNLELTGFFRENNNPGLQHFVGHAHNNFLEMLSSTGLPGVVTWLIWNLVVILGFLKLAKGNNPNLVARGYLAALFVFHLNGISQVNFWDSKVLHQLAWMTAWALALSLSRDRSTRINLNENLTGLPASTRS